MSNLLPILKNREELEVRKKRGMFVEEVFDSEQSPIIIYGIDKGDHIEYSQSKSADEDIRIKEQAIENLKSIEIPIQLQEMQGFKIAMAQHEYAAEKILDKEFLKKLAEKLDANSIVIGIPMKGFLAAVAKGKGEANLFGAVDKQYNNAQTYPISNALFIVIDGEIEMMGGNYQAKDMQEVKDGVLEITGKNDKMGKIGYRVKVGNESEGELTDQIQAAFQKVLLHVMKDPKSFNGKIDFHVSPEHNPLTSTLEVHIKRIAKNISERGAVQIIGGISGEEFKVRFFYGDDKLMAETIETDPVQMKNKVKNSKPDKKPWWKFW
jgi:predicted transposase YbfD/YdcC